MGEALTLGNILNGVVTNAVAGGNPLKGLLMNASLLAGSPGASQLASSGAQAATQAATQAASQTPVIPGIVGGPSQAFYNPALSTPAASQYQIPGLVGGPSQAFSNPAVMSPPPIQGLVGGPSSVFSNPSNPITESMVNGMNFPLTPGGVQPAANPSYWEQFKVFNRENPGLTQMGLSTAKDVLTDEQPQMSAAPAVPVQARNQLRPYDPISYMDPYKQTVVGGQPISLI